MLIVNFKAIGLLEAQNPSSIVCILESRLESTRGPKKNGGGEKYHLCQEFLRDGAILGTFSTYKAVILQGRTQYKQVGKFHP
jgi:hypothetical protein